MHKKNLRSEKMRSFARSAEERTSSTITTLKLCSGDDPDCYPVQQISSGLNFKMNEININSYLSTKNGKFNPLDLSSVIDFQRDVSTLSKGKISFDTGELIAFREDINSNIKLDLTNNTSILTIYNTFSELNSFPEKTINTYGFKYKISIFQKSWTDGTYNYTEARASVTLVYTAVYPGITKEIIKEYCDDSPTVSGITFTKDRTENCITPLGENGSILINSFLSLKNPDFYYTKDVGIFKPLDLYKAIVNRRYLFTNSNGKITITSGQFISGSFDTGGFGKLPNDFKIDDFKNSIKLDDNKKNLIIAKPLNNYAMFDFKFKITIKQEATDKFGESTTSVILEYSRNNQDIFPKPRCSVNDNGGDCYNYFD